MTVRDLVNKVLRGLRKTTVDATTTSLSDEYELFVLQMLNDAKELVEESWDWEELRNTVTLTVTAGTSEYELVSTGSSDTTVSNQSRLLHDRYCSGKYAQVFDTTDSNEDRLYEQEWEYIETLHIQDEDQQQDPCYFALRAGNNGNMRVKLWPTPSTARTITLRFVIPQAELSSSDIGSNSLYVPARPVWMRALVNAHQERGEELGRPLGPLDEEARWALANAIARQQNDADITGYPV